MAWHISARILRTIVAVADTPSMTAAAARLNVTPSALSHQVRDAEAASQVALFNRTKRRLTLTPLGQQLLASARIILEELDRAEEVLERSRKGEQPVIRLGGGAYPIHRWFLAQGRAMPATHVDYISRTGNFPLARAVAQGEIDIAFAPGETHERGITALPLFDDELVAVVSTRHPLRALPHVEARDLRDETYITYSRVLEYGLEDDLLFRPARHAPPRVIEASSVDTILDLVASGLGFSILSHWALAMSPLRSRLVALPLTSGGLRVRWSALTRVSDSRGATLRDFVARSCTPLPPGLKGARARAIPGGPSAAAALNAAFASPPAG